MDRRAFLTGAAGSLAAPLVFTSAQARTEPPEPKSTHTFFDGLPTDMYAFDVDLKVTYFPATFDTSKLFYPAVQVGFDKLSEWAHGGVQWAGPDSTGNSRLVNWGGGYTDKKGVDHYGQDVLGGKMSIVSPYQWVVGRWYRYRVWLIGYNPGANIYRWGFWVYDSVTGVDSYIGQVRTRSSNITGVMVWMETGYGVTCSSDKLRVIWRNPLGRSRSIAGDIRPPTATANYNGTCLPAMTNQAMISNTETSLMWYQSTLQRRSTPNGAKLW